MAAWPLVKKRKNGHTRTEKDRPTQKNTSKPKKKKSGLLFCLLLLSILLSLLLLLFLLLYTFLFHDLLGRVRTRDPDPGHFGPDFDSGSGHGSAFTDPQSGCQP